MTNELFNHAQSEIDLMSSDSVDFRDKAEKVLETYNKRLEKVGYNRFQIRLNLFFTFVQNTSVQPEDYDQLQSVEGSIMNGSEGGTEH